MNRIDLREQVIVCVGGAGGLGGAFSDRARQAGADVWVIDRRSSGSESNFIEGDVTDQQSLSAAFELVGNGTERIDVVINFAGVHHQPMDLTADLTETVADDFRRVVEINLVGAFFVTAVAAPRLVRSGGGHIIHLCSNGSRLSLYGSYAYNASKHGVEGLVKTAAAQLAPYRVRVNGFAPGTVLTDLNRDLLMDAEGEFTARAMSVLAHTPSKQFASASGVVESLASLCVPQAHLTGNVIFADDGYNIEGHSWPNGNKALYESRASLAELLLEIRPGSSDE